ncbi:hypothetical protein BB561_005875 [Smittium simulii]|uniref:J domain-containing protein n=1 Tax=Smittium simulii TaxID=133385 RepID=A0A2T9Y7Z0_9FUNG|nr:hypothetical protein BB561_005875 [Smittium simulii]
MYSQRLFSVILFVFFCTSLIIVSAGKDFYALLGIRRDASNHEIKKAYKKLSKKYHPDKNKEKSANEKFIEIQEAYSILTDKEKRKVYDRYGEEGLKNNHGGFGSHHDMFEQFFGGFGGFGGFDFDNMHGEKQKPKGETLRLDINVGLEELYFGTDIDVDVSKQKLCSKCGGTGANSAEDVISCPDCGGKGIKIIRRELGIGIIQQMQTTCNACGGRGKSIKHKCDKCKGTRVMRGNDQLNVEIPAGSKHGQHVIIEDEADEHPDHETGSVVFEINQDPHPLFTRDNNDLHIDITISLLEALTGFKRTFKHLNGDKIEIDRSSSVTIPHYVEKKEALGMPIQATNSQPSGKFGDLYIKYWVEFPEKIDDSQKSELGKLFSPIKEWSKPIGLANKPKISYQNVKNSSKAKSNKDEL